MKRLCGKKLEAHRLKRGLTRKDVAQALGIESQSIYQLEADKFKFSKTYNNQLAEFFKIPLSELMGDAPAEYIIKCKSCKTEIMNSNKRQFCSKVCKVQWGNLHRKKPKAITNLTKSIPEKKDILVPVYNYETDRQGLEWGRAILVNVN